jgi:glyoxalase family protein
MTRGAGGRLAGSRHLPAIAAKPRENPAFITGLLGMRPVRKTINQADASA